MKRHRLVATALTLAVAAALAAVGSPAATAASTTCSGTFHVLHDDQIGSLRMPAGMYSLTASSMTCSRASHLFAEFLQDYDGKLPQPWRFTVQGTGRGTFVRDGGPTRFVAVRTGDAAPATPGHTTQGGGTHGDLACSGFFEVKHNDRIGALRLPKGDYRLVPLGGRIPCSDVAKLFARFLAYPSGRLPGGWIVLPDAAEFIKGSSWYGFRVKRVT